MLLAYMHFENARIPELALVADKPDQFSFPLRVADLRETTAAVCRLGPTECITVDLDEEDGGLIIAPLAPAHIYITPDLPTMPGVSVKKIKVTQDNTGDLITFYIPENDRGEGWIRWIPNREKRQANKIF